jgi:hypothetical protein
MQLAQHNGERGIIAVSGSVYLVGEMRTLLFPEEEVRP